jgi:hypothetical protein
MKQLDGQTDGWMDFSDYNFTSSMTKLTIKTNYNSQGYGLQLRNSCMQYIVVFKSIYIKVYVCMYVCVYVSMYVPA